MKGDGWRRQDSGVEKMGAIDYYIDLAKMAEKAKLDFLFKADYLYVSPQMLGDSANLGSPDPTMMFAAIARETERIGLVTTISTTFLLCHFHNILIITHILLQGKGAI
jgi:alkanesulfonate monooxygenase SsuD/methylene tetrahydromethanopterin reductase-like flavin-dependent oxidoreductase (luciferase family)|nr:LLM class flavin-dependent oxidoreductase [Paenibacillus polymyxa]